MDINRRLSELERAAAPAKGFQALWQDLSNPNIFWERPPYSRPDRGRFYTETDLTELTGIVFLVIRFEKNWGKDSRQSWLPGRDITPGLTISW